MKRQVKDVIWLNTLPEGERESLKTARMIGEEVRMFPCNTLRIWRISSERRFWPKRAATKRKDGGKMTTQIAIAGKGGTGKTTFTALLLRYLMREKKGKALLAVDADANANLNEALGLEVEIPSAISSWASRTPGSSPRDDQGYLYGV
jgi:Mrp family chromosome partitioning ATPase